MNTLSVVFLAALLLATTVQLWLARRHVVRVAAHRDQVPEAFRERIPIAAHRRAADYTAARTRMGMAEAVFGAVVLLAWTLGGGLALLDDAWRGTGLGPVALGTGFLLSIFLIQGALELPFTLWRTFTIEQRFGFNRTGPGLFASDLFKQILLLLLIGAPLAAVVVWLMRETGPLWWLYVWGVWMGFSLLMLWAYPAVIAPLFNKFIPLEDETLTRRIERLLDRSGFTASGIYVMDGSRRSAHGNAYFTGIGRNKRIVFFDTLLETLKPEEIEAVLAHELGHFRRRHVAKRVATLAGLTLAGLAVLGLLTQQPWFYVGLGASTPSVHMALALFLLVSPVFTFFLQPVMAGLMRRHEFEADAYAAEVSGAGHLIQALVKLYRDNASTLTPDPLFSAFHDSHPPAPVRVAHLSAKMP